MTDTTGSILKLHDAIKSLKAQVTSLTKERDELKKMDFRTMKHITELGDKLSKAEEEIEELKNEVKSLSEITKTDLECIVKAFKSKEGEEE